MNKLVLAFRIPLYTNGINNRNNKWVGRQFNKIKMPRSERWTIEFIDNKYMYIGFGRKNNKKQYKYNLRALGRLQKKYPNAKLAVWKIHPYAGPSIEESSIDEENSIEECDDAFIEYVDYESNFPGDSNPYPFTTKNRLDAQLANYMSGNPRR